MFYFLSYVRKASMCDKDDLRGWTSPTIITNLQPPQGDKIKTIKILLLHCLLRNGSMSHGRKHFLSFPNVRYYGTFQMGHQARVCVLIWWDGLINCALTFSWISSNYSTFSRGINTYDDLDFFKFIAKHRFDSVSDEISISNLDCSLDWVQISAWHLLMRVDRSWKWNVTFMKWCTVKWGEMVVVVKFIFFFFGLIGKYILCVRLNPIVLHWLKTSKPHEIEISRNNWTKKLSAFL